MKDFTQGNATKHIVAFAAPMLIGNIFQQFYSMVDAIVVGNYVSGKALASVGTSATLLNFLIAILMGLTTGSSVVIAQFFGAKKTGDLKRAMSTSTLFLVGLSLLISMIGVIIAPNLLRMLDVPAEIFPDAVTYLRILISGTLFTMTYNIYAAYLRALGDSKMPLYFLIGATIINAVLDYVFVAILHTGVQGAAYATIISQAFSAIACFLYTRKKVPLIRIDKLIFDNKLLKLVLKYSIPAAIQLSITSLAGLTIMRLVNSFGTVSVAGYTACMRIDAFAIMPVASVSMAISTFVAQNMGAGLEDRAKKGLKSAMLLMICLALCVSAFVLAFGPQLISMFVDSADPDAAEIISLGTRYLTTLGMFYVLFAVFFGYNGFFRGVGDAVIVMVLTIVSLTLRSVSAHVLASQFGMGVEAVAYSVPIGWGLCSIFAFFYYIKRRWAGKVAITVKKEEAAESAAT